MEWDDEDSEYPAFPRKLFKGYLRGTIRRGKMKKVLVHYAQKLKEHDGEDPVFVWKEALQAVPRLVRKSEPMDYTRTCKILKDSFGIDHPQGILRCAIQERGEGIIYAVMHALPAEKLSKLDDGQLIAENCLPWGGEDFGAHWKLQLADELLPKCKESLLQVMEENKDERGFSQVIYDFMDMMHVFGAVRLLEVAKDKKELYEGLLSEEEAEKLRSFASQAAARLPLRALHQELCKAMCKGDAAGVQAMLDKKADPNFDFVDGDSVAVTPLVLSCRSYWESRWPRNIFEFDREFSWEPVVTSNLEVLKTLMAAPGIDVNAGAYSYGWHGSHVRMTPLGMAIISEIDTGNCRHSLTADLPLAAPRSEILKLLVKDPRTDLEESYFELYEGGGKVGCGALMLLDKEVNDVEIDYEAAMILMQAGALMTESWVERLGDIDNHIAKVKEAIPAKEAEVKEQLERRAARAAEDAAEREAEAQEEAEEEEAKPADKEEEEETEKEYEKKEDGRIVWQGVTFVNDMKHPGRNYEDTMKLEPKLLQTRLDGLGEVKKWSDTVKTGSNVFKTPAAFPPNFCRTAVALKKCLGKNCAGKVLEFVSFFEFNRRRPIYPLAFHTNVNMFGRPQLPFLKETDRFMRNIVSRLDKEEEAEGEDPAEKAAEKAEKAKAKENTCWAKLMEERGWAYDGDEGED